MPLRLRSSSKAFWTSTMPSKSKDLGVNLTEPNRPGFADRKFRKTRCMFQSWFRTEAVFEERLQSYIVVRFSRRCR
jgi:hypothetical protein